MQDSTLPDPPGKALTAVRRTGWQVVPGRCRGRTTACSLVLLPMAALLTLQALWLANSWQVRLRLSLIRHPYSELSAFCFDAFASIDDVANVNGN